MVTNDSELLLPENNEVSAPIVGLDSRYTNNSILTIISIIFSCLYTIVYVLLGSILTMVFWFVFKDGAISKFQQHILLCVLGVSLRFNNKLLMKCISKLTFIFLLID